MSTAFKAIFAAILTAAAAGGMYAPAEAAAPTKTAATVLGAQREAILTPVLCTKGCGNAAKTVVRAAKTTTRKIATTGRRTVSTATGKAKNVWNRARYKLPKRGS